MCQRWAVATGTRVCLFDRRPLLLESRAESGRANRLGLCSPTEQQRPEVSWRYPPLASQASMQLSVWHNVAASLVRTACCSSGGQRPSTAGVSPVWSDVGGPHPLPGAGVARRYCLLRASTFAFGWFEMDDHRSWRSGCFLAKCRVESASVQTLGR
jgi:hypothetical protein